MFLENVISFYKRLVKDKDFRSQMESAANPSECRKIMREAGYNFTQEEFETATVQILEENKLRNLDNGLSELSEQELELAFGGFANSYWGWWRKPPPRYEEPPTEEPPIIKPPIDIQPLYGVVISPDPPEAIAHYGIVISDDQLL
jgi:predicted ribosomally synthesized peptide with nif11-like leader